MSTEMPAEHNEQQRIEKRCAALELRNAELESCLGLIAMPMRPDGTWNRDRAACQQLAQEVLNHKAP